MPDITMKRERTDRWTKMRLSRARSGGTAASCHMLSSVDCITTTSESEFSVHTGLSGRTIELIGTRLPPDGNFEGIGANIATRLWLRALLQAPRTIVLGVPAIYARFRRQMMREGR